MFYPEYMFGANINHVLLNLIQRIKFKNSSLNNSLLLLNKENLDVINTDTEKINLFNEKVSSLLKEFFPEKFTSDNNKLLLVNDIIINYNLLDINNLLNELLDGNTKIYDLPENLKTESLYKEVLKNKGNKKFDISLIPNKYLSFEFISEILKENPYFIDNIKEDNINFYELLKITLSSEKLKDRNISLYFLEERENLHKYMNEELSDIYVKNSCDLFGIPKTINNYKELSDYILKNNVSNYFLLNKDNLDENKFSLIVENINNSEDLEFLYYDYKPLNIENISKSTLNLLIEKYILYNQKTSKTNNTNNTISIILRSNLIKSDLIYKLLKHNIMYFGYLPKKHFNKRNNTLILKNIHIFYKHTRLIEIIFENIDDKYFTNEILIKMLKLDITLFYYFERKNITQEVFDYYFNNLNPIDDAFLSNIKKIDKYLNFDLLKKLFTDEALIFINRGDYNTKIQNQHRHGLLNWIFYYLPEYKKTFELCELYITVLPEWIKNFRSRVKISDEQYFELLKIAAPFHIEHNLKLKLQFENEDIEYRKKLQELFPTLKIK